MWSSRCPPRNEANDRVARCVVLAVCSARSGAIWPCELIFKPPPLIFKPPPCISNNRLPDFYSLLPASNNFSKTWLGDRLDPRLWSENKEQRWLASMYLFALSSIWTIAIVTHVRRNHILRKGVTEALASLDF